MKIALLKWVIPSISIAATSVAFGEDTGKLRSVVWDFKSKQDAIVAAGKSFNDGLNVNSGLKDHESFTVTVANLNTTRYSVQVQVKANNYFSTIPSQFKSLNTSSGATPAGGATVDKVTAAQAAESGLEQIAASAQAQINAANTKDEEDAVRSLISKQVASFLTSSPFVAASSTTPFVMPISADIPSSNFNTNLQTAKNAVEGQPPTSTSLLIGDLRTLGQSAVGLAASAAKNPDAALEASRTTLASDAASQQMTTAVDTIALALNGGYIGSISGTFMAIGDETDVTITITDTQKSSDKILPVSIAIPTNGGFKTDYSGGVMLTGLTNASYRSVPNPNSAGTYIAQARNGNDLRITNVFFAHSYIRPSAKWRGCELGVSFGISADQTPVYAAGISLLLGRSQRLSLTIGESFGSVARVDGAGPFTSSTIPTTTVFMSRPFVALSYNF